MWQKILRRPYFFFTGLALVISAAPFLIGWALTPSGGQFYGNSSLNFADPGVYYSYIQQGRTGGPYMTDILTGEHYPATLFQPFWWILGKVANVLHLSNPAVYAVARLALVPLFIWAMWWAVCWLYQDQRLRRAAMYTALFAGGLGGFVAFAYTSFHLTISPDLWVAELFPMLTLWSSPHFLLVSSGIIIVLIAVEKAWQTRNLHYLLLAGVAGIVTTSIHPFHALTWAIFAVMQAIRLGMKLQRIPWRYLWYWSAVFIMILPLMLLFGLQFLYDPLTIARASQNINLTWRWPWMLVVLGFLIPLAWHQVRRKLKDDRMQWLVTWATVSIFAIYIPVSFQHRLSQDMILPFAWLAAPTVLIIWDRIRGRQAAILLATIGLLILGFSNIRVGINIVQGYFYERQVAPVRLSYLTPEYLSMLDVIREHQVAPGALLGSVTDSRVIASLTGRPVYVGHTVETINFDYKEQTMQQFYSAENSSDQQLFLENHEICFVLYGIRERYFSSGRDLAVAPELQKIFQGSHWTLYAQPSCLE